MLQPIEDKTFNAETQDVEFLLYAGDNRLFTVHRENLIKLWTLPLYPDLCQTADGESGLYNLDEIFHLSQNINVDIEENTRFNSTSSSVIRNKHSGINTTRTNRNDTNNDHSSPSDRIGRYSSVDHSFSQISCLYSNHSDVLKRTTLSATQSIEKRQSQDAQLYRVYIATRTVRNIHIIKHSGGERFLTCEYDDRGNCVVEWDVQTGESRQLKGLSHSYSGFQVRILSVLYLSPHLLAVLVSDECIIHNIDVWNTKSGLCVHRHMFKAYLPVQNIYNIHDHLIVQPWSSMAEILVYKVQEESYKKTDTGTLLTAPPPKIATYRCIISEDTGHILAGGSTLKIFLLTQCGKIKYVRSVELEISGKLLDVSVLQTRVLRLLIIDNTGICLYNVQTEHYSRLPCLFKHRNRDILVRADSGFTYRPYLFLKDNGILIIQDTYANRFYKYQIPLEVYVPSSFAEIRKNARLMLQYYEVCSLPAEMWVNVVSYTGYLYSKKFARKLGTMFFGRPLSGHFV